MIENRSVATDWTIPLTAAFSAGAGVGAGWLANRQALVREREIREQQRKAEAYVELLTSMDNLYRIAVRPLPGYESETALVKPVSTDRARLLALVEAYASDAVRNLFGEWSLRHLAIEELTRDHASNLTDDDLKLAIFRFPKACREAYKAVGRQVRRELGASNGKGVIRARVKKDHHEVEDEQLPKAQNSAL
jgi:hypothetical protein